VSSSDTFTATYSSPSVGAASQTAEIGAGGNAVELSYSPEIGQ
jgi:hypothetical protein